MMRTDDDADAGERDARTRDRSILGLGLNLSISRLARRVVTSRRCSERTAGTRSVGHL